MDIPQLKRPSGHLINSGEVTAADLKSADIRPSMLTRFKELGGTRVPVDSTTH